MSIFLRKSKKNGHGATHITLALASLGVMPNISLKRLEKLLAEAKPVIAATLSTVMPWFLRSISSAFFSLMVLMNSKGFCPVVLENIR